MQGTSPTSPLDRLFKKRFRSKSVKETPPGTLPVIPDIVVESPVSIMRPSRACVLIPTGAVDCVRKPLIRQDYHYTAALVES